MNKSVKSAKSLPVHKEFVHEKRARGYLRQKNSENSIKSAFGVGRTRETNIFTTLIFIHESKLISPSRTKGKLV